MTFNGWWYEAECEKSLREAVRTTKCDLHGRKLCRYEDCVVTTVARAASTRLAQREAEVNALRDLLAAYEAGARSRDELLITIHDRLLALDGPGNERHSHRADFPLEGEYCCICDIRAALKETK